MIMKAIVCIKHGIPEFLEIKEMAKPDLKDNEILIKVLASTVTSGDVALRKQPFIKYLALWPLARLFFGIKNQRKKILGHEFSGIVESVGEETSKYKIGDAIFGTTGFKGGAHSEYLRLSENNIMTLKPENIGFEEAAALPIGGICALHFLKTAHIKPKDRVLIYGASGSIGTFAVQLAKNFGANVTGVCSSKNMKLVKLLGADQVLDYTGNEYEKALQKYDLFFDTVGKFPKSKAKKFLSEKGSYISTHSSPVKEKQEYLDQIKELVIKGEIKAVIDKIYNFNEIQQAHEYVETAHKRGNVVIKINP